MKFKEFIDESEISIKRMGEELNIHPVTLGQIKNGKIMPKLDHALIIQQYTNFRVTVEELLPDRVLETYAEQKVKASRAAEKRKNLFA